MTRPYNDALECLAELIDDLLDRVAEQESIGIYGPEMDATRARIKRAERVLKSCDPGVELDPLTERYTR